MKTFIMILLPFSLLAACGSNNRPGSGFAPGTYVNHAQSQYSIADDTLVVGSDFQVTRRTGFRRLPDGQPSYKTKVFNGTWDKQRGALQLTENGLLLLFGPNELIIANSKYRKL